MIIQLIINYVIGMSADYWPVTAKQGKVHHPACSNANPNHNINPNPTANPNPNTNLKLLQCISHAGQ